VEKRDAKVALEIMTYALYHEATPVGKRNTSNVSITYRHRQFYLSELFFSFKPGRVNQPIVAQRQNENVEPDDNQQEIEDEVRHRYSFEKTKSDTNRI